MKNKEESNAIHLHLYTNPKSSEISGLSEFAENYLADFLTVKDYGDIIPIAFRIYVEKEMNFNKQNDVVFNIIAVDFALEVDLEGNSGTI